MNEVKEIIDGVANSLNMSVDALVRLYPQLRVEYAWYNALTCIRNVSFLFIAFSIFAIVAYYIEIGYNRKVFKYLLAILLISVIIAICSVIAYSFLCPDIVIIRDIMDTFNN